MTRDEAIQYLRALGYKPTIRTWIMGTTIHIPIGPPLEAPVLAYRGMMFLYPVDRDNDAGEWGFSDHGWVDRVYPSLEEAVKGLHIFMAFVTPYLRQ